MSDYVPTLIQTLVLDPEDVVSDVLFISAPGTLHLLEQAKAVLTPMPWKRTSKMQS